MWDKISRWGAPLWIFIIGELLCLILFIFFPTIDSTVNQTVNDTANVSSFIWGWDWVSSPGVVKMVILFGYQIGLFIAVGVAFLATNKNK